MADTKLSLLAALLGSELASGDKFYVDDVSAGTSGSKSITFAELQEVLRPSLTAFTPTLLNGWTVYDAVNYPVRYSKNDAGIVTLEGAVSGGTTTIGTALLNLPTGFRPLNKNILFPQSASDVGGNLGIIHLIALEAGDVQIWSSYSYNTVVYLSLAFQS